MNTNELKMPEPLDRTKLHSPAVVRSHDKAVADYWQAVREAERAEAQAKEAAQAHSNRVISEDDYFQMAVARDNANRLKDLERQTAALAAEKEKQDYLASNPDVAEVVATNVGRPAVPRPAIRREKLRASSMLATGNMKCSKLAGITQSRSKPL
jgi:hypothetical protein